MSQIRTEHGSHHLQLGHMWTHASRTMMLGELSLLMDAAPESASLEDYRTAVLEDNVILKNSAANRAKSFKHLRELYVLNAGDPVFGALRMLWHAEPEARPLLALLAAATRDELLRSTAETVLAAPEGEAVTAATLSPVLAEAFPDRMSAKTLKSVAQNAASSWTQSGHLTGKIRKVRARAAATAGSAVFALFAAHLLGARGLQMYETLWARLLDVPEHELDALAFAASQRGWMEYRRMGDVAEFGFSWLESSDRG
ncbi:MAG: hypothetical protein H0U04_17195 [Rubrobacter sp.]|nr:hypothetical protein [Rubrobacter sp.]MDQ3302097.1 hypothetical protein [Actinomycetota bacterium]